MSDVALKGFGGGGGAALNFKVVGNPQPANPKENTIWVNTDVKITGYRFAAEQPENMAEGEVWISTGAASQVAFNALKKNTVMVYPISAKQMVGGRLVDLTAKSYQDGAWRDWLRGIYDGEWMPGYGFELLDYAQPLGTMTINNNAYPAELVGVPASGGYVSFGGAIAGIDVTDYSEIEICTEWTGDQFIYYGISDNKTYGSSSTGMISYIHKGTKYEKTTERINVSELSGVYYFKVQGVAYVNASFKLYSLIPIK